jgi:hypothetical protein
LYDDHICFRDLYFSEPLIIVFNPNILVVDLTYLYFLSYFQIKGNNFIRLIRISSSDRVSFFLKYDNNQRVLNIHITIYNKKILSRYPKITYSFFIYLLPSGKYITPINAMQYINPCKIKPFIVGHPLILAYWFPNTELIKENIAGLDIK